MKVVILCGGEGMRLREETEYRPKPLIDIGGRPILWHIMKIYAHYGFNEFVLCLGYRGHMIKDHFLNYQLMNNDFTVTLGDSTSIQYHGAHEEQHFRVTLVDTGLDVMTGSRVARVRRFLAEDDAFIVTYGDVVADVNVRELVEFHRSHGKLATVTTVPPYSRFGVLELDKDGTVTSFAEKPQLEGWVSAGFMVFNPPFLGYLSEDPRTVLEAEPMERLVRERQLVAYRHEGFFYAMDTYREYRALNDMWDTGRARWKVW